MKKFKTKLFISLSMVLTGIVACFVAAYTINIGNQESYGILNLRKIYLRNGPNETIPGIVLDGSGYSISVASGHPGYGKIEVYQICEQSGGPCKLVSDLSTGSVEVENTDRPLDWDQSIPVATVAGHEINVTLPSNPNIRQANTSGQEGYVTAPGTKTNKVRKVDSDGNVGWNDDNNTRQENTSSQNGYVTAPNGNTGKVRKVKSNGNPGWDTDSNTRQANTSGQEGYVTAPGTKTNKVRKVDSDGNVGWKDDTNTHYTDSLTIKGGNKTAVVFNQSGNKTLTITGGGGITVTTGGTNTIIISGAAGGGDGLRQRNSSDNTIIEPKGGSDKVSVGNDSIIMHGSGYRVTRCAAPGEPALYTYVPTINYSGALLIRHENNIQCATDYIYINSDGLGLGGVPDTTAKLRVEGNAIIRNHHFNQYKVGINTTIQGQTPANLQVGGGIKIGSNATGYDSNHSCIPGSIEYSGGAFYGCNNAGVWALFQMYLPS